MILKKANDQELDKILNFVCDYMVIDRKKLLSGTREYGYPFARAIFYKFIKDTTEISGASAMKYIGYSDAMQTYYKTMSDDEYIVKPLYMKFKLFMGDKVKVDSLIKSSFKKHPELKEKLLFIFELINRRFETKRFRKIHLSQLKDILWLLDKRDEEKSILDLAGWFEDFATEYFTASLESMQDEFWMRGAV